MSDYVLLRLQAVEAMAPYRLRTTWSTGEVLEVDVEDRLHCHPRSGCVRRCLRRRVGRQHRVDRQGVRRGQWLAQAGATPYKV